MLGCCTRGAGHANKHSCHQFNATQPTGLLHRAFSVFLFDSQVATAHVVQGGTASRAWALCLLVVRLPQGRLLLQQRAKSKITFPSVWTNTCCSHPLHGQEPAEVDQPQHVADGSVPGAARTCGGLGANHSVYTLCNVQALRQRQCASCSTSWASPLLSCPPQVCCMR